MRKLLGFVSLSILFLLVAGGVAMAQGGDYDIDRWVTSSGGGVQGSEHYTVRDVIGQAAAGRSQSEHFLLEAGFLTPPTPDTTPPSVTTNTATDVTTDSATLRGDLTSMGTATSVDVSFEYGLTDSYGSETTTQTLTGTGTFSANLSGLTPDTTYHFTAKAVGDGTAYGADMTFTTFAEGAVPPEVNIIEPADLDVVSDRVKITAKVSDADNDPLTVSFLINGGQIHTVELTDTVTAQDVSYLWDTFPDYDDGSHKITVTGSDGISTDASDSINVVLKNSVNVAGEIVAFVAGPAPDLPIAGALLELILDGQVKYSCTTDENGGYSFENVEPNLPGERYDRRVLKNGVVLDIHNADERVHYDPGVNELGEVVRIKNYAVVGSSPIDLHVYDAEGRHTGLVDGEIELGIPLSWYSGDTEPEVIVILNPAYSYELVVFGEELGTFDLQVSNYILIDSQDTLVTINLNDVIIAAGGEIRLTYDFAGIEEEVNTLVDQGYSIEDAVGEVVNSIDSDGDGIPDVIDPTPTVPGAPPLADAGPDQTVTDVDRNGFEDVTLDGSGSYDLDGTIVSYEWKEGATILGTVVSFTHSFAVGSHTVTLTVTDNDGEIDSDEVVILVKEADVCFIATAAYGTSTAAELDTLRAFRDQVLLQNSLGSRLVALYYEVSPPVADFISEHQPLRTLVRELLVDPVVWVVDAIGILWRN